MESDLVIVGAIARIATDDPPAVKRLLNALEGVETFDLPEPEKLGILIETDGIDAAHARLCNEVNTTDGVLGTWPVSLEIDGGEAVALHPSTASVRDVDPPPVVDPIP